MRKTERGEVAYFQQRKKHKGYTLDKIHTGHVLIFDRRKKYITEKRKGGFPAAKKHVDKLLK